MTPHWNGDERRTSHESRELEKIADLIAELKVTIEQHLVEDRLLRPKLNELLTLLERSKGVIIFLKLLLFIAVPVTAFLTWAKDHIK